MCGFDSSEAYFVRFMDVDPDNNLYKRADVKFICKLRLHDEFLFVMEVMLDSVYHQLFDASITVL